MKISYGLVLWTETFVYEASATFVYSYVDELYTN